MLRRFIDGSFSREQNPGTLDSQWIEIPQRDIRQRRRAVRVPPSPRELPPLLLVKNLAARAHSTLCSSVRASIQGKCFRNPNPHQRHIVKVEGAGLNCEIGPGAVENSLSQPLNIATRTSERLRAMFLFSNADDEVLFPTIAICKAHNIIDKDLDEFGISCPMIHVYCRIFFQLQQLPLHGVSRLGHPIWIPELPGQATAVL